MEKNRFKTLLSIVLISALSFTSCSKDDDDNVEGGSNPSSLNVSKPKFEKDLTSTNVGTCAFKCRFTNGGDKINNMKCKVHYEMYSSKPKRTPRVSDLTRNKSIGSLGSESTSSTTTFYGPIISKKGYTIYYMFECSNSGHTVESPIYSITVK